MVPMLPLWLYGRAMETQTNQALAAMTDEGLFERVATAVLRLVPDYEGMAHTGINADGKTRKSPVDGLRFLGEGGSRLIIAHHTITAANALDRKWLLDPITLTPRKRAEPPPAGDVIKSIEIVMAERVHAPHLAATLVLATNQEPNEKVIRKAVAVGRTADITVDVWTRSRIAAKLDIDPRGQFIRRKLLGIEAELLSRPLLEALSDASLAAFDAGYDPATRVARGLDVRLTTGLGPVTLLVAPSGSGKTVACHEALTAHRTAGGVALILPHAAVELSLTLEQAIMAALNQLHPSLAPGQNAFAFVSEEDPLLLLVEDISRSSQPQRLVEKLTSWAPKANFNMSPPWRLLCPVWPHLLGGVRSQLHDRIAAMSLRPEPMSLDEAGALVMSCARLAQVTLDEHQAKRIAGALGSDPLLIALNRDWTTPRTEQVIERFAGDALTRIQANGGIFAAELHTALLVLGQAMLKHRALDPAWSEVLSWGLAPEVIDAIRTLAQDAEILRIDGPALDTRLRFRHDRVRDWLLVFAVFETIGEIRDETLADPALAEIMGAILVRAEAPESLIARIRSLTPLALFHALRIAPVDSEATRRIAGAAIAWLGDPDNLGPANETLRWQAMAAIEEVEGDFMLNLIALFEEQWSMGLVARLRNGDVEGGVALSERYPLSSVAYWTRGALAARHANWAKMIADLAGLLDGDDNSVPKRREALIEFGGVIGDPALAPAIERLWVRDETRAENLGVYLWAMARCATPETAAYLLHSVCAAWGALSDTNEEDNSSSPRDDLAADEIRSGFARAIPEGALEYFVLRAKQPDLSWPIEYMLNGVDHPTAILFEVERGAERLRRGDDSYVFNNHAREHWGYGIEGWGTPMSETSREVLLELWRDENADPHRRRAAFDFWAATNGAGDLAILRGKSSDMHLRESILRHRLQRGDTLAIPELIERLGGEHGMRWWYYVRYVWSGALYEALDQAIAREAAAPNLDGNAQYEIGSTLTRPLLQLPPADAEPLLLRYWNKFGATTHFVQTALHVATPELLARAATSIAESPEPAKLFEHFTVHYGMRAVGGAGITRKAQIEALTPYLHLLRPEDIKRLADACDDNGWYALRREQIDPQLRNEDRATPKAFRSALDRNMEHPHARMIEYPIDDLLKADVPWISLTAELQDWLAEQSSPKALELARYVIRYAGDVEDLSILDAWPGTDGALRAATVADLRFTLRRRNRER